jgi:hypothetical protein
MKTIDKKLDIILSKKCGAGTSCKRKIHYTILDHRVNKEITLCDFHYNLGGKAWRYVSVK